MSIQDRKTAEAEADVEAERKPRQELEDRSETDTQIS